MEEKRARREIGHIYEEIANYIRQNDKDGKGLNIKARNISDIIEGRFYATYYKNLSYALNMLPDITVESCPTTKQILDYEQSNNIKAKDRWQMVYRYVPNKASMELNNPYAFKSLSKSEFMYILEKIETYHFDSCLQWRSLTLCSYIARFCRNKWFATTDKFCAENLLISGDVVRKLLECLTQVGVLVSTTIIKKTARESVEVNLYHLSITEEDKILISDDLNLENVLRISNEQKVLACGYRISNENNQEKNDKLPIEQEKSDEPSLVEQNKSYITNALDHNNEANSIVTSINGDKIKLGDSILSIGDFLNMLGKTCSSVAAVYNTCVERNEKSFVAFKTLSSQYEELTEKYDSLKLENTELKRELKSKKDRIESALEESTSRYTSQVMSTLVNFSNDHINIKNDLNKLQAKLLSAAIDMQTYLTKTIK